MKTDKRELSLLDQMIVNFDQSIKTLFVIPKPMRESPASATKEGALRVSERNHSAGLMRVNHAGEVCAQALYQGQAITARTSELQQAMEQAAAEENDHLAWCSERLQQLHSHPSYLNACWYLGALSLGVVAGLVGDKWSLGFVAETERQVVKHLERHLKQLPRRDEKSRKIVTQMKQDEAQHATMAVAKGAAELPGLIKRFMALTSKVMTKTAYWV